MIELLDSINKAKEEYEARSNNRMTIGFSGYSDEFTITLKVKKDE